MKIISWNVNGIRSAEKDFLDFIASEQPDILCLQELRADPNQLSFFLKMIDGYQVLFNPSDRPGYAGTAVYYKNFLDLTVSKTSGNDFLDDEGRTIVCQKNNLLIFNFYVPNGNSSPERLGYKMKFYQQMTNHLTNLIKKGLSVIIAADLNVAHKEIDLFAPKTSKNSGFLPQERAWMDQLLSFGFIDSFRIFEKGPGHYTWWHLKDPQRIKNKGWRYDYFLVSTDLKNRVEKSEILKEVFGSDHCPIKLVLS